MKINRHAPKYRALSSSAPLTRKRGPKPAPVIQSDLLAVRALADELQLALTERLGSGCSATPALSWNGAEYDTRAVTIEVPASVADRILDDLRTAQAAERLLRMLGSDQPVATAQALAELRSAVAGRTGQRQLLAVIHAPKARELV